jgi:hypothetical protein
MKSTKKEKEKDSDSFRKKKNSRRVVNPSAQAAV